MKLKTILKTIVAGIFLILFLGFIIAYVNPMLERSATENSKNEIINQNKIS